MANIELRVPQDQDGRFVHHGLASNPVPAETCDLSNRTPGLLTGTPNAMGPKLIHVYTHANDSGPSRADRERDVNIRATSGLVTDELTRLWMDEIGALPSCSRLDWRGGRTDYVRRVPRSHGIPLQHGHSWCVSTDPQTGLFGMPHCGMARHGGLFAIIHYSGREGKHSTCSARPELPE